MNDTAPPPTAACTPHALALEGPVHRDDGVYLSALDLRAVQLARKTAEYCTERKARLEAERRAVAAEVQLRMMQLQQLVAVAERDAQAASASYTQLMGDLGARYDVDVTRLSYDDRTGRIAIEAGAPTSTGEPTKSAPLQEG